MKAKRYVPFFSTSLYITPAVLVLGMFFICCLIVSNILVIKITTIPIGSWFFFKKIFSEDIHTSCGIITFPLTYFLGDVITEVYGFRTSRLVIWTGLVCMVFFSFFIHLSIGLPSSYLFEHQESYVRIFDTSFRITIASIIAYFFGEFANALLMSRMKVKTKGKYLWARAYTSTFLGNIIDTTIFFIIIFLGIIPISDILKITGVELVLKSIFECICIPLTYGACKFLKNYDKLDVYDS